MEFWTIFWQRIRALLRPHAIDRDLEDEINFHLAMREQRLRRGGLDSRAAPSAARRAFGNATVLKETTRDVWTFRSLERLSQDAGYSWRIVRKNPVFTATAVVMLALGIGINTAIFSVFSHVLLAPLQFPDAGALYVVSSHAPSRGDTRLAGSGPDFRDFRDQNTVFSGIAGVIPHFSEIWTGDGEPHVVNCAAATEQFFSVLGIRPVMGRFYPPEDYKDLHGSSILVSWKFWQGPLGGDPHVVGRSLRIEDASRIIIGVLPPTPDLYSDVDVWDTLATEPSWDYMNWRANKFLDLIARLRPGTSRNVAEQQLTAILRRAVGEPPDVQAQLTPLRDFIVGPVRTPLDIMMAAVALVLLVTCMNTAALLLSRAVKRTPELAVRMSLGASRGRIRHQLLVEGVLLSATGGVLGVALSSATIGLIRQVPGVAIPRLDDLHVNSAVLLVCLLVVSLTSALFAVLPAKVLSDVDLATGLRGSRTETGATQRRPFSALVVAEIACAAVLTVCAGLLVRSFVRVQRVDLGFEASRVLTAYLRTNYFGPEGFPFWRTVLDEVSHVPGAASAAVSDCMPGVRANAATLLFADRPNTPDRAPAAEACWVSPDFFRTLGSPLLKGRLFSNRDNDAAPPVVIMNAAAAQRFFPGQDPLGKRLAVKYIGLGTVDTAPRFCEIVGVVSNVRQRAPDLPGEPAIYLSYMQDETHHVLASMNLFVRSAGDNPALLAGSVRSTIQSRYPAQPVESVAVMSAMVSRTLARRTYGVLLMLAFAGLALLLSAIGIYSVVSYVTAQRTREFGIRMALGATRRDVLRNVLQQGGFLVAAGAAVGVGLSLLTTRALTELLFDTAPLDPTVFSLAIALLTLVGLVACLLPALRASHLDPRLALNTD